MCFRCEVLGRFVLPVKICSCPKRDKEKEEQDAEAKNGDQLQHCGPGKRRMSSCVEKNEESKKIKIEHVTPQNVRYFYMHSSNCTISRSTVQH